MSVEINLGLLYIIVVVGRFNDTLFDLSSLFQILKETFFPHF